MYQISYADQILENVFQATKIYESHVYSSTEKLMKDYYLFLKMNMLTFNFLLLIPQWIMICVIALKRFLIRTPIIGLYILVVWYL